MVFWSLIGFGLGVAFSILSRRLYEARRRRQYLQLKQWLDERK